MLYSFRGQRGIGNGGGCPLFSRVCCPTRAAASHLPTPTLAPPAGRAKGEAAAAHIRESLGDTVNAGTVEVLQVGAGGRRRVGVSVLGMGCVVCGFAAWGREGSPCGW